MADRQQDGIIDQDSWPSVIGEARSLAEALPDLFVEATQVANAMIAGWHGRRRSGPGESFWQFRPFNMGEPARRIDWRRSAKDDSLYVREREWEQAHTVWLWPDLSVSMNFRSRLSPVLKRDRAVVLMLALAEMLATSGERVGLPGLSRSLSGRNSAETLAQILSHAPAPAALPETAGIKRFSDIVLISDFLDPVSEITAWMSHAAGLGVRGHIVQVLDPIEETFPFDGRVEFHDQERGTRLTTGRAESWRDAYQARLERHRAELKDAARRAGWSFILHHTDRSAAEPLLALHAALSGGGSHSHGGF